MIELTDELRIALDEYNQKFPKKPIGLLCVNLEPEELVVKIRNAIARGRGLDGRSNIYARLPPNVLI